MTCHNCAAECARRGRNRNGTQRYQCFRCRRSFSEARRSVGNMYLPFDKARLATQLLVEGNSIRSTSRIVGIEENTVISLLTHVGEGCRELLEARVRRVKATHLEIDETWTFVGKKQKRVRPGDGLVGDAYCYIALDRPTRLVVAHHLGRRDDANTIEFIRKVCDATMGTIGRFQISSDAFASYQWAISLWLSTRVDYARIVKVIGPSRIEGVLGDPDLDQTETTYVERINGTLRQHCRRFMRKGYAFSKQWAMLEHALALFFTNYNFCWVHKTLEVTPAMAAKITDHPWSIDELLERSAMG